MMDGASVKVTIARKVAVLALINHKKLTRSSERKIGKSLGRGDLARRTLVWKKRWFKIKGSSFRRGRGKPRGTQCPQHETREG